MLMLTLIMMLILLMLLVVDVDVVVVIQHSISHFPLQTSHSQATRWMDSGLPDSIPTHNSGMMAEHPYIWCGIGMCAVCVCAVCVCAVCV